MGIRIDSYGVRRAELERLLAQHAAELRSTHGDRFRRTEALLDAHDEELLSSYLAREPLEVRFLLRAFVGDSHPRVVLARRGQRRWWIGSLAEAIDRAGLRDDGDVAGSLVYLRALAAPFDTGCHWLDALEPPPRGLLPGEPGADAGVVDFPLVELAPVLDAAVSIERFRPPSGRTGMAPPRDDLDAWTTWVRFCIDGFRELERVDYVVSSIL